MKPNQAILDRLQAQGFSFLHNVSPEFEAQYEEVTTEGFVHYRPIAVTGSLSAGQILVKHAANLGAHPDQLRAVMDAYRNEEFHHSLAESLRKYAALFVKTENLATVLERQRAVGA